MSSPPSPPPLKEVSEAAKNLPPFPDVVWKVMPLIENMAPVSEIESVMAMKAALTAFESWKRVSAQERAEYLFQSCSNHARKEEFTFSLAHS